MFKNVQLLELELGVIYEVTSSCGKSCLFAQENLVSQNACTVFTHVTRSDAVLNFILLEVLYCILSDKLHDSFSLSLSEAY